MAKPDEPYQMVLVESYLPERTSGLHGKVHIRPCPGQALLTTLRVECSKRLSKNYPVGTKFRIKTKLTDLEGGGEFLYSYFDWKYEVIERGEE
ncbi:hypothetical protein CKO42_22215 [Lamprobacter modestohalophilus]|uniref:Uncharacterized protein n=1 Tax=Lamprobacter modestohalophilus TaxID=1064514 RepID=A0A9X0WCD6_9GAMM|nr:hypothetical protein [Lamprobacter modestohalophilus]MBK1621087.1 hypothetical protein [Lamprobacter modestohalophilus]